MLLSTSVHRIDTKSFHWLIPDHFDTTVAGGTVAAYDRAIACFSSRNLVRGAGVFRFDGQGHGIVKNEEEALRYVL